MSKKRTRNLTSGFSCVTCDNDVEEHGVECQWCYRWEYPNCAGLTSGEYSVLTSSSVKIMFFCSLCYSKVPFALRVQDEAVNYQQKVDERIKLLEDRLSNIPDNITEQLNRCCTLIQSSINKQETDCQSILDTSNKVSTNDISTAVVSPLHDEKEKEKRCMNLIIHNLPESDATSGQDRKQHDVSKVTKVFNKHLGLSAKVTNAYRLSKKNDKAKLLKVSVGSKHERAKILSKCTQLHKIASPSYLKNVFVIPDLIRKEQEANRALRAKLADMNKSGNTFKIKNGQIVQKEL